MSAIEFQQPSTPQADLLASVFPLADAQVVTALSAHTKALTRYLAQIHDLTFNEASETINAFFDVPASRRGQSNAA